jgi:adenine C2-methylase RlmN of 23S rRNA A2503 and tRNA A37
MLQVEKTLVSADNSTVKLLVRLQDGALVETVVMRYLPTAWFVVAYVSDSRRYDRKNNPALLHKARSTVCISSQVGCKMGCTFCATGTMGFM